MQTTFYCGRYPVNGNNKTNSGGNVNIERRLKEAFPEKSFLQEIFHLEGVEKQEQITITSLSAGGKTSCAEGLSKHFPEYKMLSGGKIMRAKAEQLGMKIEAFAEYNRKHPELGYDKECDVEIYKAGLTHPQMIVEARLAHCFVPTAFHVYLHCPLSVRAYRRYLQLRKKDPDVKLGAVMRDLKRRDENDRIRYETLYPGCMWEEGDYDLSISTYENSPEKVVELIIAGYTAWLKSASKTSAHELVGSFLKF